MGGFFFSWCSCIENKSVCSLQSWLVNKPGVARAVLQTHSSLIKWLSRSVNQSLSDPLWKYLQNNVSPKPKDRGSWHLERMFNPHHISCFTWFMSHVMCYMSHVKFHVSFVMLYVKKIQSQGASPRRVCYLRGLPRLVYRHALARTVLQTFL